MLLLDGRKVSKDRLEKLKSKIADEKSSRTPCLSVIRVGNDSASKIYVGKKIKTCLEIGMNSKEIHLSDKVSEAEVLSEIENLNKDPDVHGILVQLPLPKQISIEKIISAVDPRKDVDGFHPINLGKLAVGEECFAACTPMGILNLLKTYDIPIQGKSAVIMGRSRIVGRPMSLLLDRQGATVTVVHSATPEPAEVSSRADILVVAIGKMHLVGVEYIKEGAVVIDVGMHQKEDGKLAGDVDFEAVKNKVQAITPVPGGIGPMTICSLLENTWKAFKAL